VTEQGYWLWDQVHTCNNVYGLQDCRRLTWVTEHMNDQEAPDKPVKGFQKVLPDAHSITPTDLCTSFFSTTTLEEFKQCPDLKFKYV